MRALASPKASTGSTDDWSLRIFSAVSRRPSRVSGSGGGGASVGGGFLGRGFGSGQPRAPVLDRSAKTERDVPPGAVLVLPLGDRSPVGGQRRQTLDLRHFPQDRPRDHRNGHRVAGPVALEGARTAGVAPVRRGGEVGAEQRHDDIGLFQKAVGVRRRVRSGSDLAAVAARDQPQVPESLETDPKPVGERPVDVGVGVEDVDGFVAVHAGPLPLCQEVRADIRCRGRGPRRLSTGAFFARSMSKTSPASLFYGKG